MIWYDNINIVVEKEEEEKKKERLKNIKYFFVLLFMLFVCDENNCEIFYIEIPDNIYICCLSMSSYMLFHCPN